MLALLTMNEEVNFRCITWNARSVANKKTEVEAMTYQFNLDIVSITETWLNENKKEWHIRGYRTFRYDRQGSENGGGVMTLIKKDHTVERIQLKGSWVGSMEALCIKVKTEDGPIYILTIYIPPNIKVSQEHWFDILDTIPRDKNSLLWAI